MLIETNQVRTWLAKERASALTALERIGDPLLLDIERERLADLVQEREHLIAAVEALANAAGITKYCAEVSHAGQVAGGGPAGTAPAARSLPL